MRRWLSASRDPGGPTADALIDHPQPWGELMEADHMPLLMAPDPGGIAPRAGSVRFTVAPLETPVQHSPITNWSPGTPYPGPPAAVAVYVDRDSQRWWGRTGQGQLVWSDHTEFSADLPPAIPQDMLQHVDNWSLFAGGYPSMARNRPSAFGDQVPVLGAGGNWEGY